MKKSSSSSQKLGSFLSPRENNIESQKGWSSERRRRSSNVTTPFNSGRTIPSKWDDAERWICSPVSSYANANNRSYNPQNQIQRRPKSKSGPIVPPGTAYYSNFSPTVPFHNGLVVKNLMMSSPFTTGVLAPDALSLQHFYAHDTLFGPPRYDFDDSPLLNDNGPPLSSMSSAPLWSELLCEPSSSSSQDEKRDGTRNEDTVILSPISKIDKGTQMSSPETENDDLSSPKSHPTLGMDQKNCNLTKLEMRDVQVDNHANVVRWSKNLHGKDLKKTSTENYVSDMDTAESAFDTSKLERDEAKILAWEGLQKAKAEAAIRELEMKLEKKRSSSMDKILNKLRRAQMKGEKMRSLIPDKQNQQVSKTYWKVFSFRKYTQTWSPNSCFGNHDS